MRNCERAQEQALTIHHTGRHLLSENDGSRPRWGVRLPPFGEASGRKRPSKAGRTGALGPSGRARSGRERRLPRWFRGRTARSGPKSWKSGPAGRFARGFGGSSTARTGAEGAVFARERLETVVCGPSARPGQPCPVARSAVCVVVPGYLPSTGHSIMPTDSVKGVEGGREGGRRGSERCGLGAEGVRMARRQGGERCAGLGCGSGRAGGAGPQGGWHRVG